LNSSKGDLFNCGIRYRFATADHIFSSDCHVQTCTSKLRMKLFELSFYNDRTIHDQEKKWKLH
jgi:hypothetical protein